LSSPCEPWPEALSYPKRAPHSGKADWATGPFGVNFAGQTASRFFGDFLYPTIFSEDPRSYRMAYTAASVWPFRCS
jgi:hypothetical protein